MPLIAKTSRWVDPRTFRQMPVWYPETHRGAPIYDSKDGRQYTSKKRSGVVSPKTEPNIQAGKAIRQAKRIPLSWRGQNWTVCHIWGIDDPTLQRSNTIVCDPRYYSCVGNMVLPPTPLKAFTDSVPEIKYMLRLCAYNVYGWVPSLPEAPDVGEGIVEMVKSSAVPDNYPPSWPSKRNEKLPPGVMLYDKQIGEAIRKRKRELRLKLDSTSFPNYPPAMVRKVLEFWHIDR